MHAIDRERTRWFLRNVLPHEPALRSWLGRRQPLGLDVDDIIQESYAILADLDTVEDIRNPRAYLFQVARSVITRHVRRARVVSIHTVEDLGELELADDRPSPEQIAIDRDELGRLAQAIGAMPAKTQEAFMLRRVEGLSQREISARMAISENTVEKHISRGLRFLIDWFGHGGKALAKASREREMEIASFDGRARNQSIH
ncbi:RNA polymerase sigma-70 factor (ECF subfamily) [Sphingomonas kyeonggiensis]|uniref:RNA polymerase sigma factor n=1 Tax=Sphingomonas kyeonggiensis TaxID=1268553 RepID=UPI0027809E33|nr:sigma-70 family RNA polymerase sigma factor [Sphingomonas kyeonggiensis]MDQ0251481.1 RNA polymerase sigma-70 factor (ECF subfamily) [Sphingomonas kyeonggiensis]